MHLVLLKTIQGFVPDNPATIEAFSKIKIGQTIHGEFRRMRNPGFHRKFFALLNLAFEYWEPGEIDSKYGKPEKNFDQFRKDVIILAGFYKSVIRLDGSVRIEPESISFGSMDQDTFERLYNAVLMVCMERIPVLKDMDEEEVDKCVNKLLEFA